ncbi:MAG: serine racemase VanT catalytic subunit [Candidatus Heteroscillospira sp.]|jgi:serine/alanine racemase
MRTAKKTSPTLDLFRLAAVLLVVMNHTSPLADVSAVADFWLTRVLARVAVPFFLMTTGYFLSQNCWAGAKRQLKKLCLLYGVCVLLYLPVNLYAGSFNGPADVLRKLLVDGTFYHLWYFPAIILGIVIARWLSRFGLRVALPAAALLYLIGLGGDSYYGLVSRIPPLRAFYDGIFTLCGYTRNGLFFAPLFLLLGAAGKRWSWGASPAGFFLSLAAMSAEGLWLHRIYVQRHDSMYLALPLCMVCLFSLLLSRNRGECRKARGFSTAMYMLHPLCIVLVRGAAKVLGLEEMLIENSILHFIAVLALSALLSAPCLLEFRKKPSPTARAWREVDLTSLVHNAQVLRNTLAPGTELMAVVKAEAYGHGGIVTTRALQHAGIRAFAVACLAEGIALRKAGIRGTILVLGYTAPEEAPLLARWNLTQTVADIDHGRALAAQGQYVHVHLALDTGMHRLGIPAENREDILDAFRLPNLVVDGVFSHLCVSDSLKAGDVAYTQEQLTLFYDTVAWLRIAGYDPGKVHIQSSYGLWNLPAQPCDYVRAGIALYGVRSDGAPVQRSLGLRPVLSLRARVASIRTMQAGESAGYGRAFQAEQETKLAVVTIGYADGLPRDLPQRGGQVLIRGRRCPMVGQMCMDQVLVDISGLPEAASGDKVTLIGRDGGQVIQAEELAACCGTITNELLSRLGGRLPIVSSQMS